MSAPDRGYWDASYPPSVLNPPPPPIPATGATAGIPGSWTPAGCEVPANLAAVQAAGIVATPATAWTAGQYVQTKLVGAPGRCWWNGSAWAGGAAPAPPAATGATAGTPGTWTPAGAAAPANAAALTDQAVVATPTTAWTTGQHMVLGDNQHCHWDGSIWVTGSDAP